MTFRTLVKAIVYLSLNTEKDLTGYIYKRYIYIHFFVDTVSLLCWHYCCSVIVTLYFVGIDDRLIIMSSINVILNLSPKYFSVTRVGGFFR